jgi:transcriptional regulator with XRE-family HTH domain
MGHPKFGRQLAAARVLAGYDRTQLARAAGLAVVTVKRLELLDRITAHSSTLDAIERALAEAGVELGDGERPSVAIEAGRLGGTPRRGTAND